MRRRTETRGCNRTARRQTSCVGTGGDSLAPPATPGKRMRPTPPPGHPACNRFRSVLPPALLPRRAIDHFKAAPFPEGFPVFSHPVLWRPGIHEPTMRIGNIELDQSDFQFTPRAAHRDNCFVAEPYKIITYVETSHIHREGTQAEQKRYGGRQCERVPPQIGMC